MDPILGLNENSTNLSTAKLSELVALAEPFPTILGLLYGGTAFIAFMMNIIGVNFLIKKKKIFVGLRKYLINLAVTDISTAVFSVPFIYTDFMYGYWRFPLFMCPLSRFTSISSICNSIFTLTAIGIERYLKFVNHFY